jgi:hypothetical protein
MSLPAGGKGRLEIDGFVFQVGVVAAGRPVAAGVFANTDWNNAAYVGLSLVAHTGLLAALAFFMPPLGLNAEEGVARENQYLMQQYLQAAAEREQSERDADEAAAQADDHEGANGTRAAGAEGAMGTPNTKDRGNRYGIKGPENNPDVHVARHISLRDAAEFGIIGLLNNGAGGDPHAPTAPFGRADSLGSDPRSALGNMWGNSIGEAFGYGGLGLMGMEEGGGGRGEGIGLGEIGTIDHGGGTLPGNGGFGPGGQGHLRPGHATRTPQIRVGVLDLKGHLPPEVIQRIVRQNYGRFRLCYENGLRNNPSLHGRVEVRFVIGRDGAVSNVSNGNSDMPDSSVVKCVVSAYYGLSFPQPDSGIVTVVYPIMFSPSE